MTDRDTRCRVNILAVDLRQSDLEVATAKGKDLFYGTETLTSLAARKTDSSRKVIAALNGDFFNPTTGEVHNNQITDGIFLKAFASRGFRPQFLDVPNSQFAMTSDNRPMIEQFTFDGSIIWRHGQVTPLAGVNIVPRRGGMTIFNGYLGESSPPTVSADSVYQLLVLQVGQRRDTLVCVCSEPPMTTGALPLTGKRLVVAGYQLSPSAPLRHSSPDDTLRLVLSVRPHKGDITNLIGGWPRLVRDGKSVFRSTTFPEDPAAMVFTRRHPRTGVGFSRDGRTLYLITVDGRQENSAGMSLPEFADLMVSLGVAQGLNLDGGGSTTMVINGDVVNSPSDPTGERAVGNCLVVYARTTSASTPPGTVLHH